MSRTLYPYYERELYFLRQMAQEFGKQYPATAGRLLLEPNRSVDPHVERMLQGFALLAGRVQHKLDDEFPELTTALLGLLFPHYLAPFPSCAILQFEPDPSGGADPSGFRLPAGTRLHTQPIGSVRCRYRTAYPVTLWPVTVTSADWVLPPFPRDFQAPPGSAAAVRIVLELSQGARFADLQLDKLRLFLNGDPQLVADLYEAFLNRATRVVIRDPDATRDPNGDRRLTLNPKDCLSPVGFGLDEGLVPVPPNALPGYRLLTEYFSYPHKFNFVDVGGFAAARKIAPGRRAEILVFTNTTRPLLEQGVDAGTFRTGCSPIVNLFERTAEPVPVTHARTESRIVPDVAAPMGAEVYSIDDVKVTSSGTDATEYLPFFGVRYGSGAGKAFWHANRRASEAVGDKGTEVYVSLVDLDFHPRSPADGVLVARTTCTNRDLPTALRQSGERAAFAPDVAAPLARVRCLHGPTAPLRPFTRRGAYWRLVAHLNSNHLSANSEQAAEAVRGLLGLYDFTGEDADRQAAAGQLIFGVTSVKTKQVVRRVGKLSAGGFCRGLAVEMELDEEKFVGSGAYLFASVMERFIAVHATLNSFTQLTARTRGAGPLASWPPRAGAQPLL